MSDRADLGGRMEPTLCSSCRAMIAHTEENRRLIARTTPCERWLQRVGRAALPVGAALLVTLLGIGAGEAQIALREEEPTSVPDLHAVEEGETLFQVSERFLGTGDDWPKLWSFNPEITNPHWIYPGHVLRLKEGVEGGGAPPGDGSGSAAEGAGGAAANGGIVAGKPGRKGLSLRRPQQVTGIVLVGEQVFLDRAALATAARIVGSGEDHLMLSPTDEVYLQYKERTPAPAPGSELTVFTRLHRREIAAKAGKVATYRSAGGEIVRVVGALRIKNFDQKTQIARAVVTEALDPLERGFEVADVPHRLAQVAPKKNGRDLDAKIIGATRALSTLGEGQLVFLDVGAKRGVEVGNRLWVVRQGDPWRQQLGSQRPEFMGAERPHEPYVADRGLPKETVAELRILYVRPENATALITSSVVELSPGERVEMQAGY